MSKLLKNKKGFTQHHFQSERLGFNFKSNRYKSGAGFTLIETTVAMVVLMVGLLAVMQFFPFALKIIGDSQNITTASNIAVAKIEQVQAQNYDDISTGTIETKQKISSDPTSYLYDYQRETVVEYIDSNFATSGTDVGLKKITVNVYWTSPVGLREKSISLKIVVSDR